MGYTGAPKTSEAFLEKGVGVKKDRGIKNKIGGKI